MTQTTSRLEAASQDNATLREEVETLNKEQKQLRNRLSTADEELATLHGQVAEAHAAREEARRDVVAGRVQLDRIVAVLQQQLVHDRERESEQTSDTGWKGWVGKDVGWTPWMVFMFMFMFVVVWLVVSTWKSSWAMKSLVPWNGSLPFRVSMPAWREGVAWFTSHAWAACQRCSMCSSGFVQLQLQLSFALLVTRIRPRHLLAQLLHDTPVTL